MITKKDMEEGFFKNLFLKTDLEACDCSFQVSDSLV